MALAGHAISFRCQSNSPTWVVTALLLARSLAALSPSQLRVFGMLLVLLRSQSTSMCAPQRRAYRKAQASAVLFANGYRRPVQK
jgi:hypothetical protein